MYNNMKDDDGTVDRKREITVDVQSHCLCQVLRDK